MKKTLYLFLSTILGLILSIILHAGIEFLYLTYSHNIKWYYYFGKALCALPPWLFYGLLFFGIAGGFLFGFFWWRIVYVQKRGGFFRKK